MESNFSPSSDEEFDSDNVRASTPFDETEEPRSSTPNANSQFLNNSNPNETYWNEFQEQDSDSELNLENCPDPTLTEEQLDVDEAPCPDPTLTDEQFWVENSDGEQFEPEQFEQSFQQVGAGDIIDDDEII